MERSDRARSACLPLRQTQPVLWPGTGGKLWGLAQGTRKGGGDVAIIGMACMFPGARDLDAYWQNILNKVDAVTDPPPEAWDSDVFYDPDSDANDRVYCKRGGFLGPLAEFNPLDYGIMPAGLEGGEPDQWLALKIAYDALADAGYLERLKENPHERHRTAVILGKGTYLNRGNLNMVQHSLVVDQTLQVLQTLHPEYSQADLQLIRAELKKKLPPFNAEAAPGLVPNITAGRIANRLDLMGPSYTVDAACASSLVAVEIAMRDLLTGQCDLALVGGAQVTTPIPILTLFCQLGALSRRQEIRPFDKDADGTILSEGLGMIVLKRREDAERDGDRIYAVVKAVGTASDGRATGVLTPRVEGEVLALRRAYEMAGIAPETVGLIEAHGTGTPVGDLAEIQALREVFSERDGRLHRVALGSVKSMIGHAMPAAGIASIIKAALALYHKVLPPTIHCDEPNPRLELEKTPFYINTEVRPWIHGVPDTPRRAGVNAFGFGGINAHLVLEEAPESPKAVLSGHMRRWESEVVILAAASRPQLIGKARRLIAYMDAAPDVALLDLAYTVNSEIGDQSCRLAVVAESIVDLREKLTHAVSRLEKPEARQIKDVRGIYFFEKPFYPEGKLAFLFPGEGAQYTNMLADLCLHFPEVRVCFGLVDRAFFHHPRGRLPSDDIFPRPAFSKAEQEAAGRRLWELDRAVEGVLTANQALYTLLRSLALQPDVVVGHSSGEFSALRAAGVIDLADETRFIEFSRGLNRTYEDVAAEGRIPRAVLVAVGAGVETMASLIGQVGGDLHIAMANCPHQTVVVGGQEATRRAVEQMQRQGLIHEVLPFDRAYHTPQFEPYAVGLRRFFAGVPLSPPRLPIYSCTTAALFPDDVEQIRSLAVEHWVRPVLFQKTVEAMYADGVRIFVEVGPRGNLTAFVDDILRGRPYLAVPANVTRHSGITQLNHLVGLLAAQGVPLRLEPLYARRAPQKLTLDTPSDLTKEGKRRAGRVKSVDALRLATGWAPMSIPEEVAARVREKSQVTGHKSQVAGHRSQVTGQGLQVEGQESQVKDDYNSQPPTSSFQPPIPPGLAQGARNPQSPSSQVMSAYLQTMERFLEAQQEVMQAYLTATDGRRLAASPEPVSAGEPGSQGAQEMHAGIPALPFSGREGDGLQAAEDGRHQPEAIPAAGAKSPISNSQSPVSTAPSLDRAAIRQILVQLVSEKTGYPAEMLDLSLDLEADLGIDSIKRVEILGAFQRETGIHLGEAAEQLAARRTLQGMIDFLAAADERRTAEDGRGRPTQGGQAANVPEFPFVEKVITLTPGESLGAECELSLDRYPFLRDHTLGRQISLTDAEQTALPVVPLTMSMEMLAEAGAVLMPGRVLVEMRRVRGHRWIALEAPSLTLRLVATRSAENPGLTASLSCLSWRSGQGAGQPVLWPGTGAQGTGRNEVEVRIYHVPEDRADHPTGYKQDDLPLLVEGIMVFDTAYPLAPAASLLTLQEERPSAWTPERLYSEGMFHGDQFRAVTQMARCGADGAVGTLKVLPWDKLFSFTASPHLVTDPVILDAAGQVIGLWAMERFEKDRFVFPFYVEAVEFYGPPRSAGEDLTCQARIRLVGSKQTRSDIELIGADGRLWARLIGWEDKRFDAPVEFFRFSLSPQGVVLSTPWPIPCAQLRQPRSAVCVQAEDLFTSDQGFWHRVWAHLILTPQEREEFQRLRTPEIRRVEWLLGRMVAKDAVRLLLQREGLTLCPADIEIGHDGNGRPVALGAWADRIGRTPALSITHTNGRAAAIAGWDSHLGLDMEHLQPRAAGFDGLAFTEEERAWLDAQEPAAREEWALRFWCAKESVAKALGVGLGGAPQRFVVQPVPDRGEEDASRGMVRVRLAGEMATLFPDFASAGLVVYTARDGEYVVASTFGETGVKGAVEDARQSDE